MYSQTVILMLFWGFSNEEVVLVKNKAGIRKTETGEFVKRAGWGGPAGKVEEGETLLDAALRELEEETNLRKEQVEIYPEPIAQIRKGNHTKKLLVGRVLDTRASLNIEETNEEISKCRRFSLKSLPGGKVGIYEDHLELFLQARKKLVARGEDLPIVAIDEKVVGHGRLKDRPEHPWQRPPNRLGGREIRQGDGFRPKETFQKNQEGQRDKSEKTERYIYEE